MRVSDHPGSISIQATNMAGLSATCSTNVSTFTTSPEWLAVADTMDLKSETVAAGDAADAMAQQQHGCVSHQHERYRCGAGGVRAHTIMIFLIQSSITCEQGST